MRITGYRTLTTVHDWGHPVGDANGVVADGRTEVPVLLVETDEGVTGVGLGPHAGVERVFPAVEGEDPRAVTALYDRMLAHVFKTGHAGAVFGAVGVLDMALWDLKAKLAGEPLWRTLGARDRFVPGYASCLDAHVPDDELPVLWKPWVERGFTAVKVKGGLDLDADLHRLRLAREVFGVHAARPSIMLDTNETWTRKQTVRHVQEIEREIDLTWIEEPVRRWDVAGHLAITQQVRASVASGENLTGIEQLRPLVAAGAVDVVQTGSCWGITHFLRAASLAHAFDLPVSPVGYDANPVAVAAAAVPNHLVTEIQDLTPPVGIRADQSIEDGGIVLGDEPGNGLSVDEDAVAAARRDGRWSAPAGPHVRPRYAGRRLTADPATHPSGRVDD